MGHCCPPTRWRGERITQSGVGVGGWGGSRLKTPQKWAFCPKMGQGNNENGENIDQNRRILPHFGVGESSSNGAAWGRGSFGGVLWVFADLGSFWLIFYWVFFCLFPALRSDPKNGKSRNPPQKKTEQKGTKRPQNGAPGSHLGPFCPVFPYKTHHEIGKEPQKDPKAAAVLHSDGEKRAKKPNGTNAAPPQKKAFSEGVLGFFLGGGNLGRFSSKPSGKRRRKVLRRGPQRALPVVPSDPV